MTFLCLWSDVQIRPVPLLTVVPRVVVDGNLVWSDIRGMPPGTIDRVHMLVDQQEIPVRIGIATVPIAAQVAARYGTQPVVQISVGEERAFLAPFLIDILHPHPRLANLLDGAGIERCGDLATLTRESVEVRFGAEGARLWRLARADDPRPIFSAVPRTLPSASFEWTDYTLRRAERLLFVINGLCGNVCETLRERGEGAVAMVLRFSLANKTVSEYSVRATRATASQSGWMRLLRLELERIVLPDAVTGISLDVTLLAPLGGTQGDVFDLGFGTAHAAEEAIAGLLDDQGAIVVEPENTAHPLLDRRTTWTSTNATQAVEQHATRHAVTATSPAVSALTLQLLSEPARIAVVTAVHRGDDLPRAYRNGRHSYKIVAAAGPDRVSGGRWDEPYAREYYRCVNDEGMLVWMYRDGRTGAWYLHGWWD